jgi:UDP-N-acetylglucosamine 4,6-dehydratase
MRADVPKVVVISSDKACSPETVYGATKAAAEAAAIGANAWRGKRRTRISVVRYGNVLGSQGSFLDSIVAARQTGATLPITDLAATRFWWSIDDAVAFVGDVLGRMQGTEIWIPKLVSAKVVDLVKAIAPNAPMIVTGTRGPEKTHEAMINATEARYAWELPDCYVLLPKAGQWWSPDPPAGAVKVADGFRYASDGAPTSVRLESLEDQPCALQ